MSQLARITGQTALSCKISQNLQSGCELIVGVKVGSSHEMVLFVSLNGVFLSLEMF